MITIREGVLATVCVAIAAVSIYHKSTPCPAAETKTAQDDKIIHTRETSKKVKTTVTQTTKPDGTKTTITTTEKDLSQVTQRSDDKSSSTDVVIPAVPEKTKYAVGIDYEPAITRAPSPGDVGVNVRTRVADTDFWVGLGYSVKQNQVRVGVQYEW